MNNLKKYLRPFRNKFILASTLFVIYVLFLDDVDIFTVVSQNRKLNELANDKVETEQKLEETKAALDQLHRESGVERYAREKKFFKRDNEDIFVISYE